MDDAAIPAGPRGFVESGGEQVYYESWGSGDVVVLTHGMGGNHAVWYQQVPALATRYRVITWDQRGFGHSTASTGSLGPEPSVGDLAVILDHLGVDRAHLIGQSMGGWPSLGFALAYPERAASLVLADTIGGIFTPHIREAFLAYAEVIAAGPPPDQLPLGSHPALGPQLARDDPARAFLYSQIGSLAGSASPIAISELLASTDHTARLDRLAAPTLFVVGENDPIFPPDLIREAAAVIPGSEVRVIDDTGHSPYFERAEVWNGIVIGFLRRST